MIIGNLHDIEKYYPMVVGLEEGVKLLQKVWEKPNGTYNDGKFSAIVQDYISTDISKSLIEVHRKYIDLQVVCKGNELIGWSPLFEMTSVVPYDDNKDVEFLSGNPVDMIFRENDFFICFPEDGHRCKGSINSEAKNCRKICIKIPIGEV